MIRMFTVLALLATVPLPVFATDDGGFGEKFTNKAPSALMEAPDSQIAQSVQTPSADELQNIMPAAGDDVPEAKDVTSDILNAPATTTHETVPEVKPEETTGTETAE